MRAILASPKSLSFLYFIQNLSLNYDYIIVGAGLFGATFARLASDAGKKCLVIDKRNHIAGNAFTQNMQGIVVHQYGAHIFHTNHKPIWDFVNRFAKFNDYRHLVKVSYQNQLYSFPINQITFRQLFGFSDAKTIEKYLVKNTERPIDDSLESFAKSQVGEKLFEIFIKGYTEKQWGRSCAELPSSILKRIPVRSNSDEYYFDDDFQGIPIGGYTKMVEKMLDGIDVQLNTDFFSIKNWCETNAHKIVYTGPIDAFFDNQFGELEYRSLRFEIQILQQKQFQEVAVINYSDAQIPFTRIIEHKHFEKSNADRTVVTKEFPQKWDIGKEPFYPINDKENNTRYAKYKTLAEKKSKYVFGGRLAEYRYYDMHQVIASAMKKFEKSKK